VAGQIIAILFQVKPKVGFTLPFTWTVTVNLNLCKYLSERYGGENNVRRTRYYKTVVERYSELHQPEGTVTRMNKFMDIKYKVDPYQKASIVPNPSLPIAHVPNLSLPMSPPKSQLAHVPNPSLPTAHVQNQSRLKL
jgi:hypothetical protein